MSAEFSNTYQEILLDNLMSVIKQNFLFQTQLKMVEGLDKQRSELFEENQKMKMELENLRGQVTQLDVYKNKAEQNTTAHEEKSRIQTALNEEMKKSSSFKKQIEDQSNEIRQKDSEIKELKDRIFKLESAIPQTKLKKIDKPQIENFIKPLEVVEESNTF
jgi:regulator of replication initiation timing